MDLSPKKEFILLHEFLLHCFLTYDGATSSEEEVFERDGDTTALTVEDYCMERARAAADADPGVETGRRRGGLSDDEVAGGGTALSCVEAS